MTGGLNEVQTGMNTVIKYLLTVDLVLVFQIRVESCFNVLNNRLPAVENHENRSRAKYEDIPIIVIDKITKTRGIHNS